MQFYTVHEPPDPPIDRIDRAERLVFIGDRFTSAAVAFGPLWLLANRLWHAFAIYLAALGAVALIVVGAGLNIRWLTLLMGAFNLIVAFEAASLKRWALERKGWHSLGTVSGRTLDECERRFLETWMPDQRMARQLDRGAATSPGMSTVLGSGAGLADLTSSANAARSGRLGLGERRRWLSWRPAR